MGNGLEHEIYQFSRELRFMLAVLALEDEAGLDGEAKELAADLDWGEFLHLADHHRVYPILYAKLKHQQVPDEVKNKLRDRYNSNTLAMLLLSSELDKIVRRLDLRQIRSLVLKGPVLAQSLYGDVSLRTSKDLDIYVRLEDFEQAENILFELGYQPESDSFPRILNDWKWKAHHYSYYHKVSGVQIELHWRLNAETGMEPTFDELWARRSVSSLTGDKYPVHYLGEGDLFLYLISHGARHGWFRLRWLTDIDQLLRHGIRTQNISHLMNIYQCRHLVGQALVLSSMLLRSPLPQAMLALSEESRSVQLAIGASIFIRNSVKLCPDPTPDMAPIYQRYLHSIKTTREIWGDTFKKLYPSSRDAAVMPLPKPLHFLYFPLRPFLWLWRQMKKQPA